MKLNPLREGAATPRPWVDFDPDPTAVLVADFVGAKRWGRPAFKRGTDRYADVTQIPGWQYSGSTSNGLPRYAETRGGKLVPFANGVPRITDRGLLVEEARTNLIPWNRWSSTPTWSNAGGNVGGMTRSITGYGLEGDVPYVDFNLSGMPVTSGDMGYNFLAGRVTGIAPSTAYTMSAYFKVLSNTGAVSITDGIAENNGSSELYSSNSVYPLTIGALQRMIYTKVTSPASANLGTYFLIKFQTGVPVNITVRFYLPQLEQGAFATSGIATAGGAATRAADIAYITGLGQILGGFRTNKVTIANANPTTTAGISTTGNLAVSVVDDVAELAAAGLQGLATTGKVFKLDNSAGAAQAFAGFPGISGNTNTHTASAYLRGGLGVFCIGSVGCNAVPASTGYVRRSFSGPGFAGGGQLQVGVNAGQVMYVILPMLEESATVNEVIVTQNGAPTSVGIPITLVVHDGGSAGGTFPYNARLSNETNSVGIGIFRAGANGLVYVNQTGGSDRNLSPLGGAGPRKMAFRSRAPGLRGAVDGALSNDWPTDLPQPGLSRLNIGAGFGGSNPLNGYVERVTMDASDQLQALAA